MKLYGALASPYVARVAMFARLKGIDLPMESAPGGMGSAEYKALNPIGKIPSLDAEGFCIAESEVICEYLEDIHPEPSLIPGDATQRARARMISRITDLYIAPHNTGLIRQQNPANRDQEMVDKAAASFAKGFSYLEHFMGEGGFAAGDQPSIGDCALAPFIILLKQSVFPHFDEIPDPTEGDGRLAEWWQAIQSHPGCSESVAECDAALKEFLEYLMKRIHGKS
jgi:glutathione S-transferase